ncbi:MAG TPA: hypothetical protein DD733_05385, partial [Clostridiales bacterium]|nr:hypothetical protein [Clostridiales bacterium]
RKIKPATLEMKKAYQPVKVTLIDEKTGKFCIENRNFFTSLDNIECVYTIEADGVPASGGFIDISGIAPGGKRELELDINSVDGEIVFITFSFILKSDCFWAKKGYEITFEQIELKSLALQKTDIVTKKSTAPEICRKTGIIEVKTEKTTLSFCNKTGMLASIILNGKNILEKKAGLSLYRAPIDND